MRVLVLFSACVTVLHALCPEQSDLPLKYNSNTFMCAKVYVHDNCGGSVRDIYNYEHTSYIGSSWNDEISSLVTRPGCTLTVYEHSNYGGWSASYSGKVTYIGKSKNDEITGWVCKCEYTNDPLRCTVTDEWRDIVSCNNPSLGQMACGYDIQKGLSLGSSVTEGKTISESSHKEMGGVFEDRFRSKGKSSTTSYNWSSTSSTDYSYVTTTRVDCQVYSYGSVVLKQVIGVCGDTEVFANHYECARS